MRRLAAMPLRSLAFKLILACEALILIGGGISWYSLIRSGREELMADAVTSAATSSDLVKKSLRFDMLTVNREGLQRAIEDVGAAAEILRIRILSNTGKVGFSNRNAEIGLQIERTSFACRGCHDDPARPAASLSGRGRWVTSRGPEGFGILTFIDPIYNEASCARPGCHLAPARQRVLGIIETDFSLRSVDRSSRQQTRNITIYAVLLIVVSSLTLYAILRRFIFAPMGALVTAMGEVARGNLGHTVPLRSQDEMGRLARTFNDMTQELGATREKMERWTQTLELEVSKKTEELRRSQDRLVRAEKLAALGRLTAEVAHEIRNPLSVIGGFARRLHKVATEGKGQEYADIISAEADRLERILRDVLTFSRDARFHLEEIPVGGLVAELADFHREAYAELGITIETVIEPDLPPALLDRDQVRQALGNLLSNAVDSIPGGGTIRISAESEEVQSVRFLCLRVADTGKGIPAEDLELIFEPFFSTKSVGHGTGLGLSITRKIIEEHGGFIRAQSTQQRGSVFSLCFPLPVAEAAQRVKCWEFMRCGRDKDATVRCPAYPHFGRICWVVAGTFCEGKPQGTFAQKYEDCTRCEFYRQLEAERDCEAPRVGGDGGAG